MKTATRPAVAARWIRNPSDRLAIAEGCWFDDAAAERPVRFIERFCRQSKGEWAGKPLVLQEWQRDFLRRLFGWKRPDGRRRFTKAYLEVPKKNGKSTMLSGLALCLLLADAEGAPEVYVNACDRSQASIVFDEAARMIKASPELARRLDVIDSKKLVVEPKAFGKLQANSKEAGSKDGLSPSGTIFDELHRQDRALWEMFEYAGAARRQPLIITITTAGRAASGVWYEQREQVERINAGLRQETHYLGVVYRADPGDDIDDPATWRKANPSLGVTIDEAKFRQELDEAKGNALKLANFLRLRLGIIGGEAASYIDLAKWDKCSLGELGPSDLAGRRLWAGLDLSTTNDLSAVAFLAEAAGDADRLDLFVRFYLPKGNIAQLEAEHGQPYRRWADEGLITLTDGDVIDYDVIEAAIVADASLGELRKLFADPHNATQITTRLANQHGLPVEGLRQGFISLGEPTSELARLVAARRINHGGNPILRWHAGNAMAVEDDAGNRKISKRRSRGKIDGIAATIDAVAAYLADRREDNGPSPYESRGLELL